MFVFVNNYDKNYTVIISLHFKGEICLQRYTILLHK